MDYQLKSGNILRVEQEEYPDDPRTWDNIGTMICSHGNYKLGDEQVEGKLAQMRKIAKDIDILPYILGLDEEYLNDADKLEEFVMAKKEAVVIRLFLYEHSGITMHMYQPTCRWDSMHTGYIYVSQERIIKEYGNDDEESIEKARSALEAEVKVYAQYLEGDIYEFKIIKQETCSLGHVHEEVLDSCGGFYGYHPEKNGMLEHINDELLKVETLCDTQTL